MFTNDYFIFIKNAYEISIYISYPIIINSFIMQKETKYFPN